MMKHTQKRLKLALMATAAATAISTFQFAGNESIVHASSSYYVSPTGSDSNSGTSTGSAFKTIQKAANTAAPGDTVYVRGGTYNQKLKITKSGTAAAPIIFQSYSNEKAVIDGSGLKVSDQSEGLVEISNASNIKFKGFEVRNFKTSVYDEVPMGISIFGSGSNIELSGNKVHRIESNAKVRRDGDDWSGRNAHGIAVYGTESTALKNITITGNELSNLVLGSSEALVLNGNVDTFKVTNNLVHDNDNIGIDIIGFEGTAPQNDQARNGLVSGNTVYNTTATKNPSYGPVPNDQYSAGGIYVDGGKNVVIERNKSYNNDIGVELASEHQGKSTSGITLRNNLIYGNSYTGIAIGGYDTARGSTVDSKIVNNTLVQNDTIGYEGGQILLQYDTRNNIIKNNILVASSSNIMIQNQYAKNSGNVVNFNLYYGTGGANGSEWTWKNSTYKNFAAYKKATKNDANSVFANPLFVNAAARDYRLNTSSPAINKGEKLTAIIGATDLAGKARVAGSSVDIGAYEVK
ncbi:right-handed parallel beta-helix repeat-containing protein [Paenibacillus herberti]|nr:right-handed parallel beta-helix repeat-containing protein [Paenibacillus herberti]